MIIPTTPTEKLLFTTVRIETSLVSGKSGTGTGFLFDFKFDDKRTVPVIVTNKHVVKGALKGRFQLHESKNSGGQVTPTGGFFNVELEKFEEKWTHHPDSSIDLCAMLFQPIRVEAQRRGKEVFAISFDESVLPSPELLNQLTAVEDILMAGYPIGLWDEVNNLPLVRRGVTASHPALDYCGRPEFVIDAACFPGSSGSPVLLANFGSYSAKGGGLVIGSRIALLGVLYAGPEMTTEGRIVTRPIPTGFEPVSMTRIMIHLGYVLKARELLILGDHLKQTLKIKGSF